MMLNESPKPALPALRPRASVLVTRQPGCFGQKRKNGQGGCRKAMELVAMPQKGALDHGNINKGKSAAASISAYGPSRSTITGTPLSAEELRRSTPTGGPASTCAWDAVPQGQSTAARTAFKLEHTKSRLLGHWGSDAGRPYVYSLQPVDTKYELELPSISPVPATAPGGPVPSLSRGHVFQGIP